MNRLKISLITLIVGLVMALAPANTAQAHDNNDQPCATGHEYDHISLGESRESVHNELDFNGSEVWQEDGREKRHYKVCDWVTDGYGNPVPTGYYDLWVWYFWNGSFWEVYKVKWCGGC